MKPKRCSHCGKVPPPGTVTYTHQTTDVFGRFVKVGTLFCSEQCGLDAAAAWRARMGMRGPIKTVHGQTPPAEALP